MTVWAAQLAVVSAVAGWFGVEWTTDTSEEDDGLPWWAVLLLSVLALLVVWGLVLALLTKVGLFRDIFPFFAKVGDVVTAQFEALPVIGEFVAKVL